MSGAGTYRVGIVGCSGIVTAPAKPNPAYPMRQAMPGSHASAYALFPEIEIVAICDVVPAQMARFIENWGDRWPRVRQYTDHRALLAENTLDILSVATSDNRHADIVVDAANAGVRAIFCEKPLATTLEDADRMIEACESANTILSVDHTRRWSARYHQAREIVRAGELGDIGLITGVLGGPRAMLFRNGTHAIDMIHFFAESDPAWVWAINDPEYAEYEAYAGDGGRSAELEPGVLGFIEFVNGRRAFYTGTKHSASEFGVDILGREGKLVVRDAGTTLVRPGGEIRTLAEESYVHDRWAGAIEELLHLIEHGGSPVSDGREARKTVAVMLGFLESHRRGNVKVAV